jgi:hypothetical protein
MITPAFEITPLLLAVTSLMIGLALITTIVGFKHFQTLGFTRKQNRAFVNEASPLLVEWDLQALKKVAAKFPTSPVARIFAQMASRYLAGVKSSQGLNPVDLAEGAARLGMERNTGELKLYLSTLRRSSAVALALGLSGALFAAGTPAALSAGFGAGLILVITALLHHLLSGRIAAAEAALRLSAEEFLYEMACNYDRDTMNFVLRGAA